MNRKRTMRAFQLIAFLLLSFCIGVSESQADPKECSRNFAKLAITEKIAALLKSSIGFALQLPGKATLYPIVGPIRLVGEAARIARTEGLSEVWRAPFRIAKKDGAVIAATATFAYLGQKIVLFQVDFNEETKEFRSELGKKNYVYVDIYPEGDHLDGVAVYNFEKLKGIPKTHYIKAKNYRDMLEQLRTFKNKNGEIYGLSINGHGYPGYIQGITDRRIEREPALQNVFSPNAQVTLDSCYTGNGEMGEAFVKKLGASLLDKGGIVYSSRVPIVTNGISDLAARKGVPAEVAQQLTDVGLKFLVSTNPYFVSYELFNRYLMSDDPIIANERVRKTKIAPSAIDRK